MKSSSSAPYPQLAPSSPIQQLRQAKRPLHHPLLLITNNDITRDIKATGTVRKLYLAAIALPTLRSVLGVLWQWESLTAVRE